MENVTIKAPALIFLGQLWICIQRGVDITYWRFLLMIASHFWSQNQKGQPPLLDGYRLSLQWENTLMLSSFSSPLPWEAHRPMVRQSSLIGEPAGCCCRAECALNPKFSAQSLGYFYLFFTALKNMSSSRQNHGICFLKLFCCNCLC